MKMFRPLIIMGKFGRTMNVRCKRGQYGLDGIWIEVNSEIVMRYDFSSAYRIEGTTLVLDIKESYSPSAGDFKHIGTTELPDSFINISWYEKDVDAHMAVEAWKEYEKHIPFSKLTGYLVARDVMLGKIWHYLNAVPSWDVCLTLPLYMKLCEDIPGFESRIKKATEIGDQIRGSAEKLNEHLKKKTFRPQLLDNLLEKIHSLSDELELAYNIKKLGYDIKFGDVEQPDYFINDFPAEHKSRFPDIKSVISIDLPSHFDYYKALQELVFEIKGTKKGLKKAEIYFNNLSRLVTAMKFQYGVEMMRHGPGEKYFNFSDMFCNFNVMMLAVMMFREKGKVIVPYIKPICSEPKIIAPFPIPEEAFNIILKERKKARK